MRILIVQPDLGRSWHPLLEIEALTRAGHDVSLLVWDRLGARPSVMAGVKPTLLHLPVGYANWKVVPGMAVWFVWVFIHLVFTRDHAILAMDSESAFPAVLAGLITRNPVIFFNHDALYSRYRWPRAIKPVVIALEQWIMRRSYWMFVLNENRLGEVEQTVAAKTAILYNSPPDCLTGRSTRRAEAPLTILATGYLSSGRGMPLLLEAAETLPILILAAGMALEDGLEARIRSHPKVEWRGFLPVREAIELYSASDIVFAFYDPQVPLYSHASSTKLFEAMMASLPVLTNHGTSPASWVEDFNIGYVTPFGDVAALRAMLQHIISTPDERLIKGANGRRLYEERFSWKLMVPRLLAVFDRLARENGL